VKLRRVLINPVETPNLSHWWKNFGDKKAVVISADLLKGKDDNM